MMAMAAAADVADAEAVIVAVTDDVDDSIRVACNGFGLLFGLIAGGTGDRLNGMGDDCKIDPLVNDKACVKPAPIAS